MMQITGIHYATNQVVTVKWDKELITDIRYRTAEAGAALPYIAPGLVDIQINGYGGFDFNTWPYQEELFEVLPQLLLRGGVTTFCPTVVTNSPQRITEFLSALYRGCREYPLMGSMIAGIHLEGPFISPEDGPRGAHNRSFVRSPDWELFCEWQEAAGGLIKLVTLSPEWPSTADFIYRCTQAGVVTAIGHTAAEPGQIQEAVAAGARLSTHLGNGAHIMLPRHPNYIWEQLAQDDLGISLISDGFHLPDSVLKVFLRAKGDRALLVSDATSFSGLPPGKYSTHIGGQVVLTPDGKLHLASHPDLLAGSVQSLSQGVYNLAIKKLAALSVAWEMASLRPAALLGLPVKLGLACGSPADITVFDLGDTSLQIREVYKAGTLVYQNGAGDIQYERYD